MNGQGADGVVLQASWGADRGQGVGWTHGDLSRQSECALFCLIRSLVMGAIHSLWARQNKGARKAKGNNLPVKPVLHEYRDNDRTPE